MKRFGQWLLEEQIGRGGNADVWRARADNGAVAAVKVLRQIKPTSEPYQRFLREVDQHRQLGADLPGVLPVLDTHLPPKPSRQDPAWLALALAVPMRQALGSSPSPQAVVAAVADIATTLAELATRGIAHRDIKPENLYHYNERWAVGDFGLVDGPDVDSITEQGRAVGARFYIAPELIADPVAASGLEADVYGLAKTLWVLLVDQHYPPPGHHRLDERTLVASTYAADARIRILDRLIDRCTRPDPLQRPTMAEVRDELAAWLHPGSRENRLPELAAAGKRLADVLDPSVRARREARQRNLALDQVLDDLGSGVDLVVRAATNAGVSLLAHNFQDAEVVPLCVAKYPLRRLPFIVAMGRAAKFGAEQNRRAYLGKPATMYLWSGVGVLGLADRAVVLCAGHVLGARAQGSSIIWSDHEQVHLGSARAEQAVARLAQGLAEELPTAFERLVAEIERYDL